jgi:hypothetical protein
MQLVIRAKQLNQRDDMLITVYKTKKGKVIYLTGNKIAELLRKAVKEVPPDTTPDKLKLYSALSLRDWACVLLDKAGKLPDYSKKRLCWLGDSFRMYLRNTASIQHQHVYALLAASQEAMDLISVLPTDLIALPTMMEGMDGPDMHKYADKNGLRDIYFTMIDYSFFFVTNCSSKELPPQLANTSQPCLGTLPHSPHTTCNKYWETSYLALPPLGRWVQSRPFEPLSCHHAPHLFVLASSLIRLTVNGRPGASFTLA